MRVKSSQQEVLDALWCRLCSTQSANRLRECLIGGLNLYLPIVRKRLSFSANFMVRVRENPFDLALRAACQAQSRWKARSACLDGDWQAISQLKCALRDAWASPKRVQTTFLAWVECVFCFQTWRPRQDPLRRCATPPPLRGGRKNQNPLKSLRRPDLRVHSCAGRQY